MIARTVEGLAGMRAAMASRAVIDQVGSPQMRGG